MDEKEKARLKKIERLCEAILEEMEFQQAVCGRGWWTAYIERLRAALKGGN